MIKYLKICENVTCSEMDDKLPLKGLSVVKKGLDFLEKASGGTFSLFTRKLGKCLKLLKSFDNF